MSSDRPSPVALAALGALLLAGAGLVWVAASAQPGSDRPTLAPAVELIGRSTQIADRAFGQVLGADVGDELALGHELEAVVARRTLGEPDASYVEAVLAGLVPLSRKPLPYRVFVVPDATPNAFALPGGLIVVHRGLLEVLDEEAELAAVLAHELAHEELGHCVDAAKLEIASRKIDAGPLGELADAVYNALARRTWDQSAEAEADAWAFDALQRTAYDPTAEARAFQHLAADAPPERGGLHPVREVMATHPSARARAERYRARARSWWEANPGASRARGTAAHAARLAGARDPEPVTGFDPAG